MLVLGSHQLLEGYMQSHPNPVVYNFTSYYSFGVQLKIVMPPITPMTSYMGVITEYDYDLMYKDFIEKNLDAYLDTFKIAYHLYLGMDVYLMISDDMDIMNESYLKFFQQRYGYDGVVIRDVMDLDQLHFKEMMFPSNFNLQGISQFDIDKSYLSSNVCKMILDTGGSLDDKNNPIRMQYAFLF